MKGCGVQRGTVAGEIHRRRKITLAAHMPRVSRVFATRANTLYAFGDRVLRLVRNHLLPTPRNSSNNTQHHAQVADS